MFFQIYFFWELRKNSSPYSQAYFNTLCNNLHNHFFSNWIELVKWIRIPLQHDLWIWYSIYINTFECTKTNIRWCQRTKSMEICQLKATIAGRIGSHALSPLSPQGSFYLQTKVRVYNSSHIIFQLLKHFWVIKV